MAFNVGWSIYPRSRLGICVLAPALEIERALALRVRGGSTSLLECDQ